MSADDGKSRFLPNQSSIWSSYARVSRGGNPRSDGNEGRLSQREGHGRTMMTGSPDSIRVGMCASLSGQFQVQGTQALRGTTAWVEDANRRGGLFVRDLGRALPVTLIHYDDRSKAADVRTLVQRLVAEDGVHLLLGPYSSVLTMAAAQVAEELGVTLWNHGGSADAILEQGYRWTVSILSPASQYLVGAVDFVLQADPSARRAAFIHSSTGAFSRSVAEGAAKRAVELGMEVVFRGTFDSPASDFSGLLRRVADSSPDLLVGVGRIADDLLLAQQLDPSIARTVALVATPIEQFKQALGPKSEGFVGPSQWESAVSAAPDYGPTTEEVLQRLGQPDYPMAQGYAGGLVAQRCLEEAGTVDQHALRQAASALDFTTFYGRFKIAPESGRQVGHEVLLVQWQHGEKVIVWPPALAQAPVVY